MAIPSSLPSISPIPVAPITGRGSVPPVTGSDSGSIAESRSPRATDDLPESRGERGVRKPAGDRNDNAGPSEQNLDETQLKELQELKARDREVRAHEQAHQTVGGQYAGAASYTYQRGPDGNQYAIGGEVSIDLTPVEGDPQATIEKMRTVRAAAMAPAQPSGQDRAVAAQAMQQMLQAQTELSMDGGSGEADGQDRESGRSASISASNTYREVSAMVDPAPERLSLETVA